MPHVGKDLMTVYSQFVPPTLHVIVSLPFTYINPQYIATFFFFFFALGSYLLIKNKKKSSFILICSISEFSEEMCLE